MTSRPSLFMHASVRFLKITREGEVEDFFSEKDKRLWEQHHHEQLRKEPTIKWRHSKAKRLLYQDILNGIVPLESEDEEGNPTMPLYEIYTMRPEYAEYDYDKLASRLASLRATMAANETRADDDKTAFELFVSKHPVSYYSHKGYIQWQGSESQRLALEDIAAKVHETRGYRAMYDSREEFFLEFPFEAFRDKVRQEVKTAKFKHTLNVKGKQHKSS
jgi:hypothetical protein